MRRFAIVDCSPEATPMITNLKKLNASKSKLIDPIVYRQLVGYLMYLVNTRQNICFAMNTLNQYMVEPRRVHQVATKHVLKYLQCMVEYGPRYVQYDGVQLVGYTDSDWADNVVDRKSTSRCSFSLGSRVISWFNRKQRSVALSFVEVKYMEAILVSCEVVWIHKVFTRLFGQQLDLTFIYLDNQSCIKLSKNLMFHDRLKHIEIKYHFFSENVQRGIREAPINFHR